MGGNFIVQQNFSGSNSGLYVRTSNRYFDKLLLNIYSIAQWLICSTFVDQFEFKPLEVLVSNSKIGFKMQNEICTPIFPVCSWTKGIQEDIRPTRPGLVKCEINWICADDNTASLSAVLEDKVV